MFARIAQRYDLMNSLMTGTMDRGWRRAAVRAASPPRDGLALDLGTGTARLATALAGRMPDGSVIGLDLTMQMLATAQKALWRTGRAGQVLLVNGDALRLPFPDRSFDCLTSAFTVRNLEDLALGFREQRRVVRPGGRVVCLELTWPHSPLMRVLFPLYFGRLVPLVGRLVVGDASAYSYLPASVRAYPPPERVAEYMQRAGLVDVRWRSLGFGTVTLHVGRRADGSATESLS